MKCTGVIIPHCLVVSVHVSILMAIAVLHSHYGLIVTMKITGRIIDSWFCFFQIKNTTPTNSLKESSYRHILVHSHTHDYIIMCVIVI